MEDQEIGKRLQAARRQRGRSLRELAELAGLSAGFLSMVENGQRRLSRTEHINALAQALFIAPSELTGQPYAPSDPSTAGAHEAIPALRLALMGMSVGEAPDVLGDLPLLPALRVRVLEANRLYHSCEYATLARKLPGLLTVLHAAVGSASPADRPELLRLLADAYHPACTLLLKGLGYTDLAFIAVTRGADAIRELDDPVYAALSGFFHTHVLMAAGSPVQALARAEQAALLVERHLRTPQDHALLGELHLIRATCLTQDKHRPGEERSRDVQSHLAEAADLAARTGETKAWHLNFGPTNVGIHQVSLNTDLGLHGEAVTASSGVQAEALSAMKAPGRKAAFNADLGRSLAHVRGKDTEAVTRLLAAEQAAPQRVHVNPLVRSTVADLLDRQLPKSSARDLRGLAHRMGLQL